MTIEQELIKAQSELVKTSQDLSAAADELAAQSTELTNTRQTVTTLTTERDMARSEVARLTGELEKSKADHSAALEAKEKDVERRAHAKAGEIARQQGVHAVTEEKPGAARAAGTDLVAQLDGITDPVERTKFYRANKAAIDAAYVRK